MKTGRFSSIVTGTLFLNCLLVGIAYAGFGFGFGDDERGKSGLDFTRGYDINTVTSVSGRVLSSPQAGERGNVFVEIRADGENLTLCLGPRSYWERNAIPLRSNDNVTAKGSKAQGNDGKTYMMVQKLANRSTGSQMSLRDEQGRPAWAGMGGGMMGGRGSGMMDGGMMRGGGRMGGGMMRR